MSSHKVFIREFDKNSLNSGILDYYSIVASDIAKSALFCKRNNIEFVNDVCDTNKLLFMNPIVHFARYQKFFNKEEVFNIKILLDKIK